MSTARKAISKTPTTSKSLRDLCTEELWKQSIKAGKAEELVKTLRKSRAGQRALKTVLPQPVDCFIINRADGCRGVQEGCLGFVRRCPATEFIFLLLEEAYAPWDDVPSHYELCPPQHLLGGYDIRWETEREMGDWMRERVEEMSIASQRHFFQTVLDIHIPEKDSDGDDVKDATDYLQYEGPAEWHKPLHDEMRNLLIDTNQDKVVIAPAEMETYRSNGNPMPSRAVFTLCAGMGYK